MPTTKTIPSCLAPLTEYLQGLTRRASVAELRSTLNALNVTLDDLKQYAIYDDSTYRRNLIFECEFGEVLLICWKSGQRSPVHNHAGSTCGVKVLKGLGYETLFDMTPCGQAVATKTATMRAGDICASQDADVHQISNLQPEGQGLVTLHIYSPPLREMDMFSITGGPVERYRPTIFEFEDGGGI